MTKVNLEESYYSLHFVVLKFVGGWVIDKNNPTRILNMYIMYKVVLTGAVFAGSLFIFFDFCIVFGDFKKMSWNLCVNVLLTGGMIKNILTFNRSNVINSMRLKLHRRALSRRTPEDEHINRISEKEMNYIRALFYGAAVIFVPLWLISFYVGYLRGSREIPIPIYVPFEWDHENAILYHLLFLGCATAAIMGILFVIETEMAMFTLLVQISREYNRLLKDLQNINQFLENGYCLGDESGTHKYEVNPFLRKAKIKSLVKGYCKDQQQLFEYTEKFEFIYTYTMLLQLVFLSVLILLLAMLCILEYDSLSINLSYQIGYISVLFVDMFLLCWWSTRINGQCLRVGDEAYGILWYELETEIQKDISMMIRRSQHPPKITSGKFMEMDLHAFMLTMRNIYSWLTLFQQLTEKSN